MSRADAIAIAARNSLRFHGTKKVKLELHPNFTLIAQKGNAFHPFEETMSIVGLKVEIARFAILKNWEKCDSCFLPRN